MIDASKVKWDEPSIDASKVQWDEPQPKQQVKQVQDQPSPLLDTLKSVGQGIQHFAEMPSMALRETIADPIGTLKTIPNAIQSNLDKYYALYSKGTSKAYDAVGADQLAQASQGQAQLAKQRRANIEANTKNKNAQELATMVTEPLNAIPFGSATSKIGTVGRHALMGGATGVASAGLDSIADDKPMTLQDATTTGLTTAFISALLSAVTHGKAKADEVRPTETQPTADDITIANNLAKSDLLKTEEPVDNPIATGDTKIDKAVSTLLKGKNKQALDLTQELSKIRGIDNPEINNLGDTVGSQNKALNGDYNLYDENGEPLMQPAYHGTPHEVDAFDTAKIGTGEGAQAYGHGLYFASDKEVANYYAKALSSKDYVDNKDYGRALEAGMSAREYDWLNSKLNKGENDSRKLTDDFFNSFNEWDKTPENEIDIHNAIKDIVGNRPKGNLYKVELKPEEHEYLNWDKPLSEQSDTLISKLDAKYKNALNAQKEFIANGGNKFDDGWKARVDKLDEALKGSGIKASMNGADFYRQLAKEFGSDKKASDYLNSLGIKGIKYLDGTSRGKGEGNHNYVIFHNDDVEIRGKNGITNDGTLFQIDHKSPLNERFEDFVKEINKVFSQIKNPTPEQLELMSLVKGAKSTAGFKRKDLTTILLEKGYQGKDRNGKDVGEGLVHIIHDHYGEGAVGELTAREILNIGKTILEGRLLDKSEVGQRIGGKYTVARGYDRTTEGDNGKRFRVIVGVDNKGVEHIISYSSSKNWFSEDYRSKPSTQIQDKPASSTAVSGKADLTADDILPQTNAKSQENDKIINGMFQKLGAKNVITLFKGADPVTIFHEYGHYIRATLTKDELSHAKGIFGDFESADKDIRTKAEEDFAHAFVKWLHTGDAPTSMLAKVFTKIQKLIQDVFKKAPDSLEALHNLTPEQRDFFRMIFTDRETLYNNLKARQDADMVKDILDIAKSDRSSGNKSMAQKILEVKEQFQRKIGQDYSEDEYKQAIRNAQAKNESYDSFEPTLTKKGAERIEAGKGTKDDLAKLEADKQQYREWQDRNSDTYVGDDGLVYDKQTGEALFQHETPDRQARLIEWHKDSAPETKNADGSPKVFYHATTHDFDTFKKSNANKENWYGDSFYFTNKTEDANINYSTRDGADLKNRIQRYAEQLESDRDLAPDVALKMAERKYYGGKPNVMPVYLNIKKPVTPDTYLNGTKVIKAIQSVMKKYGAEKDTAEVLNNFYDYYGDEIKASEFERILRKEDTPFLYLGENYKNGDYISYQAIKEIYQKLGYDGIIQTTAKGDFKNMQMPEGTQHIIAFHPNQIKSVFNKGTFDESNPNILFQHDNRTVVEKAKDKIEAIKTSGITRELQDAFTTMNLDKDFLGAWERNQTNIQKSMDKVSDIHNALKTLSVQARDLLHGYISGDIPITDKNDAIQNLAVKLRDVIDRNTNDLVSLKMLDEKTASDLKDYVKRIYADHWNKKKDGIKSRGSTIQKIFERGTGIEVNEKNLDQTLDFVNTWLEAKGEKTISYPMSIEDLLMQLDKRKLVGDNIHSGLLKLDVENGKYILKRDWTKAEREAMGEITDSALTIPNTLVRQSMMLNNARFLNEVSSMSHIVSDKEIDGFVQVPDSDKYGALSGKWIDKNVFDHITALNDRYFGADSETLNACRKMLSTWKEYKTVFSPTAHFNNFMGNNLMIYTLRPSAFRYMKSVTEMFIKAREYEALRIKEYTGQASSQEKARLATLKDEIAPYLEAKELGVFGKSEIRDILSGFDYGNEFSTIGKGVLGKIRDGARHAYANGDALPRMALYLSYLEDNKISKQMAKDLVTSIMPDYSKPLPKGVRFLRDSGISPFISWTYFAVPAFYKAIKSDKKALARFTALVLGVGLYSQFSQDDIPDEYVGRRMPIGKDDEGNVRTLKIDRLLPLADLTLPLTDAIGDVARGAYRGDIGKGAGDAVGDLASGYGNYLKQLLGGVLVSEPLKLANIDLYNGRKLSNNTGFRQGLDKAESIARDLSPTVAGNVYDLAKALLVDKDTRRTNSYVEPKSIQQLLAQLGGVNLLSYDPEQVTNKREKETISEMRKKLREE